MPSATACLPTTSSEPILSPELKCDPCAAQGIFAGGAEQIAWRMEGPPGAPVLVLSNSLGTSLSMWDAQAAALSRHFRVLRYDTRGHGASGLGADPSSGYTLEQLGTDVLRLLDGLGIGRAAFCGISMGGLTGLWLGIRAPDRLERLVVANSAARIGSADGWRQRAAQVSADGMDSVADGACGRWFTPAFSARAPQRVAALVDGLRRTSPAGYAACCKALAAADLRASIAAIGVPTLLVAGRHDLITTPADAAFMASQIANAASVELAASHLSNIEAEAAFSQALLGFLR